MSQHTSGRPKQDLRARSVIDRLLLQATARVDRFSGYSILHLHPYTQFVHQSLRGGAKTTGDVLLKTRWGRRRTHPSTMPDILLLRQIQQEAEAGSLVSGQPGLGRRDICIDCRSPTFSHGNQLFGVLSKVRVDILATNGPRLDGSTECFGEGGEGFT